MLVRSLDRPQLLWQALDSVAAQSHPRIEVVVIAVRPGHAPLPERVGHATVRLIAADEPRPRSRAANVALDEARGEYLLFLDDDDWLMPDHLSRLVAALQAYPTAHAAYTGVAMVDADGRPLDQTFDLPFDAVRQLSGNLTPIHAVLFSAGLRERGCRFDETLDRYEDWDFWIQVARQTWLVHVPGVSAVYRIHDSSGVHEDRGAEATPSQRIYDKWLPRADARQIGALMRRVWAHDEIELRLQASTASLELTQQALARSTHTVAEQSNTIIHQAATIESQRGDAERLAATIAAQQREIERVVAAAEGDARQAGLRLFERQQRIESLQHDLDAMRQSSSWRLTAPLRALASSVRALRARWRARPAEREATRWSRLREHWRRHGTLTTAQVLLRRLRGVAPPQAGVGTAPQPAAADHAAAASGGPGTGHDVAHRLSTYVLPPHGERRVTLVVDRLDDRLRASTVLAALEFAAVMANVSGARLRLLARAAPVAAGLVDRRLLASGIELARDPVLAYVPRSGDREIDLLHDETLLTTDAATTAEMLAAVPAHRVTWWLGGDEDRATGSERDLVQRLFREPRLRLLLASEADRPRLEACGLPTEDGRTAVLAPSDDTALGRAEGWRETFVWASGSADGRQVH